MQKVHLSPRQCPTPWVIDASMKRRLFLVRILNAVAAFAATFTTLSTAPACVIADAAFPLPVADMEMPPWLRISSL